VSYSSCKLHGGRKLNVAVPNVRTSAYTVNMHFEFSSAKSATQSTEGVPFEVLASDLGVDVSKIELLVSTGWLTLVRDHTIPALRLVGKPGRAGMDWLKNALAPIPLIPVVRLKHVMELLDVKPPAMRRLIMDYAITVYIDPALGEMITIASFHHLFHSLYPWHERSRFDRQMMLSILFGFDKGDGEVFVRPMSYSQRLEEELARIATLPEPERSIRSMDVYEAYRDASTIASVVRKVVKTPVALRVQRMMQNMKARMDKRNKV